MTQVAGTHARPDVRCLAKCVIASVREKQRKVTQAIALLQEVLDAQQGPDKPFEGYTLSRIGKLLRGRDPARAIAYLERFRDCYGKSAGGEFYVMMLGRLYVETGKPDKALDVFSWLDDRRKRGETIVERRTRRGIQLGLIDSLKALGRHDEAQALADQVKGP